MSKQVNNDTNQEAKDYEFPDPPFPTHTLSEGGIKCRVSGAVPDFLSKLHLNRSNFRNGL